MKKQIIEWKLSSKSPQFGFFIPNNRDDWGGDFYVNKKHFNGAVDGQRVEAEVLEKTKGKKPEVRILRVIGKKDTRKSKWKSPLTRDKEVLKTIEWIYSSGDGNFWFIDIPWEEKGYFVYGSNKNGAMDGDTVAANVVEFKGKKEALVTKVLSTEAKILTGTYSDNEKFGFVTTDQGDIFIAGWRKNGAEDGDSVEVKIIKTRGKNPEWVIQKILR